MSESWAIRNRRGFGRPPRGYVAERLLHLNDYGEAVPRSNEWRGADRTAVLLQEMTAAGDTGSATED